jgi:glutathione synthase/RimK-type ligase-like ATP-grasp enzyme
MLNVPPNIRNASNKKTFFQAVSEAAGDVIPRFWTYSADIPGDAFPVVCRTVLAGHSGEGIVLADSPDDLVPAPLYVEYIKKEHEFRVHLGRPPGGSYSDSVVIGVQRKARDRSNPSPNWKIRNHANGFIYTRQGFTVPEAVVTAASRAFCCLGLDFGAVDVIYNTKAGRAFVLEVNTAPGLEGQTVTDYVNFFLTYL